MKQTNFYFVGSCTLIWCIAGIGFPASSAEALTKATRSAPATDRAVFKSGPLAGWRAESIGPAPHGAVTVSPRGTIHVWGGGTGITANADSLEFVSKPVEGYDDLAARIVSIQQTNLSAQAGVMARWGHSANAPFAMIAASPDGHIVLVGRSERGGTTKQIKRSAELPIDVRLELIDGKANGFYRLAGEQWQPIGSLTIPRDETFRLGLAVTSPPPHRFTKASFKLTDSSHN